MSAPIDVDQLAAQEHPYVTRVRETFEGYEAGTVPAAEFLAFLTQLRSEVQVSLRGPVVELTAGQTLRALDQVAARVAGAA
jgi:hypothetical protein